MEKVVNPTKVITFPDTRWVCANAWEHEAINGGMPKFSVSLIKKKSDPCMPKIKAAIQVAYDEGQDKLQGNVKPKPPLAVMIAVTEARKLNIPIVAIIDATADANEIDYVIPGDHDSIRAIELIVSKLADAVIEGKRMSEFEAVAGPRGTENPKPPKVPSPDAKPRPKETNLSVVAG